MKMTLGDYNRVEEKLQACLAAMGNAGVHKIVLFGASEVARIVLSVIEQDVVEVVGVIDDDDRIPFEAIPTIRGEELNSLVWDGVLITDLDGVDQRLRELGVPESKVWHLP